MPRLQVSLDSEAAERLPGMRLLQGFPSIRELRIRPPTVIVPTAADPFLPSPNALARYTGVIPPGLHRSRPLAPVKSKSGQFPSKWI
jgi:hypothetical protein